MTGAFTIPVIMPVADRRHQLWLHTRSFTYTDTSGMQITVKAGAVTDGASIPRLLWSAIGPPLRDARVFNAAAIHDQLYKSLGDNGQLTRAESDRVLYRALRAAGVYQLKALAYYWGVRIGGWVGWNRYARDQEEVARQTSLIEINHAL
jgi:hypothetical protein